tara:strand:+ start:3577 stop:3972 length:396 start_codon:yes stop_codon:yes gene_type:complete
MEVFYVGQDGSMEQVAADQAAWNRILELEKELEIDIQKLTALRDRFDSFGKFEPDGFKEEVERAKKQMGDWRVKYGFNQSADVYAEYGWWNDFDGNFEDDTWYRCDKFCWDECLQGKVIKAAKTTRSGKCY